MAWFKEHTTATPFKFPMSENVKEDENFFNLRLANLVLKSSSAFYAAQGFKYVIKIGDSAKTTALNVLNSVDSGPLNRNWFLRIDNPHRGTNYPHLNMRHKYTGIQDPHLRLPPGSLTVARFSGYLCKFINFLRKFTIIYDCYRIYTAVKMDCTDGTIINTVGCVTDIVLSYLCGSIGASIGGCVGTMVLPGIGTLFGALAGGTAGVFYGSSFARSLTSWELDQIKKIDEIYTAQINY